MKTTVLKPGFLVSLKTGLRGGVTYARVDLEPDHLTDDGARVARWETTRDIPDPDEFERATAARSKARARVAGVCCLSSFGLLCPSAQEAELQEAIAAARGIAAAHNATAAQTQVEVYVLVGRIAQDDAEAARAIGAELRGLLDSMQAGIKAADPTAIREAATQAKNLGAMLSADIAGSISGAILEARTAARLIARRVQKAGESAAQVVAECSTQRIESARFAFLDLDEPRSDVQPEAPGARGVDLDPAPARSAAAPQLPFALEV